MVIPILVTSHAIYTEQPSPNTFLSGEALSCFFHQRSWSVETVKIAVWPAVGVRTILFKEKKKKEVWSFYDFLDDDNKLY